MKAFLSLIILVLIINTTSAQPISHQSIQDSVIGWMKVYHYKGTRESKKVDDKLYSAAQLSVCDSLANWMQASYIPKGGLGDVKKAVSDKLGLYNKHAAVLPQSYGNGFSNDKQNNHITVTIKKTGEMLQVFIDENKIAEYKKAIPAALLFNAMTFSSGNSGENDKFYISNVKITKD